MLAINIIAINCIIDKFRATFKLMCLIVFYFDNKIVYYFKKVNFY